MNHPIPPNEAERLDELNSFSILHKPLSKDFEDLSKLAAFICNTEVAMINFIDKDTQWSKATFGITITTEKRSHSVCQYTILDNHYYEVEDLSKDERFCDNQYVTDDPGLKFYGGFPLITQNGFNIGTLCVMDYKPGKLSEDKKNALKTIADSIVTRLELQKQNYTLKKVLESNTHLLRVIGHDLRNPISGIQGITEFILEDKLIQDDETASLIQLIHETSEKMQHYVSEVLEGGLAMEKISSNEKEYCNLTQEISNTIQMYQTYAKNKSITINFNQELQNSVIHHNPLQVKQIIGNILSNAIKFTPIHGTINIKLVQENSRLVCVVQDTGIGMPKDILKNLFKNSPQVRRKGTIGEQSTGLGLPMVKEMLDLMGGKILVDSVEHIGTTITIYFPT